MTNSQYKRILVIGIIVNLIFQSVHRDIEHSYIHAKAVKVKKIILHIKSNTIRAGENIKITKEIRPAKAARKRSLWISRNKYVKADNHGNITVKRKAANKKVRITVKATDGSRKRCDILLHILPPINPKKPMVAVTFDDGPQGSVTGSIVRTLKKENAVATFFVIGRNVQGVNLKPFRDAVKNGNEIANHTWNHYDLTRLTGSQIRSEIDKTNQLIKKHTGIQARFMRPPFGKINECVKSAVGLPMICWSVDTRDWQTLDARTTYHTVMNQVKDGSVVLLHDCYPQTAEAVKKMIPSLIKKGYQLVTVSELIKYRKSSLEKNMVCIGVR